MFNFDHVLVQPCLVLGLIFFCLGLVMKYFPPKRINSIYGYRSTSSMRNKHTWGFAQQKSARELIKVGVIYSVILIVSCFLGAPNHVITLIVGVFILLLFLIRVYVRVEKGIKDLVNSGSESSES